MWLFKLFKYLFRSLAYLYPIAILYYCKAEIVTFGKAPCDATTLNDIIKIFAYAFFVIVWYLWLDLTNTSIRRKL